MKTGFPKPCRQVAINARLTRIQLIHKKFVDPRETYLLQTYHNLSKRIQRCWHSRLEDRRCKKGLLQNGANILKRINKLLKKNKDGLYQVYLICVVGVL